MKHRHAPYDFELEVLPMSSGALSSALRVQHTDVGNLFEFIAPILYRTPHFLSGKYWFTLVNVTCTHTDFSYGTCPAPSYDASPLACTWLYTFSLNATSYDEQTIPEYTSLRGINVVAWGNRDSKFLTIGTTHSQASEFGLAYDSLTPGLLYNTLGPVTKSFALRNKYHTDDTYAESFKNLLPKMVYSSLYMMPLYNLLSRTPYHLWVFNRHVWISAPHLLSVKHITVESLLYFCLYVRGCGKLQPATEAVMIDKFHESLTDMVQRHDARGDGSEASEPRQLLYAALTKRGRIPDDGSMLEWLRTADSNLAAPVTDYASTIKALIYA